MLEQTAGDRRETPEDPRPTGARRAVSAAGRPLGTDPRQLVLAAASLMIAAHVAFRAWALYPSWFFTDDYRLMLDARGRPLSLDYLLTPFDSQFMPLGRLVVWVVQDSGTTSWATAATTTVLMQLLASAACLWMLVTLFGVRPAVLAPLALYLTSAMALPGYMWWAAAVNQLPLQVVAFVSVATWVRHLRGDGRRWAVWTVVALGVGLLAYVKVLLLLGVLAYLLLAYFCTGGIRERVRQAVRAQWPVAAALAVGASAFLVFYVSTVQQPFAAAPQDRAALVRGTADGMLATSLPTAALGGPWTWFDTSPPTVLAEPPSWAVHLAWVVVALVVLHTVLRRHRAGRAWLLLGGYALAAFALLATSRGQLFGRIAGIEYRYLTDALPILVLVVGLAFLPLPGAPGGSVARREPLLRAAADPRWAVALTVVVALGGIASSWQYVQFWHDRNAGRSYVKTIQNELRSAGRVDLADQVVPPTVMPEYTRPRNRTAVFVPLVADGARFPTVSDDLHLLDGQGLVVPAVIETTTTSVPGPEAGCGWRVDGSTTRIPLEAEVFDYTWWLRIGYLGAADGEVVVTIDGNEHRVDVERGLHSLFVETTGTFDEIAVTDVDAGPICIDTVEVGSPVPREQP